MPHNLYNLILFAKPERTGLAKRLWLQKKSHITLDEKSGRVAGVVVHIQMSFSDKYNIQSKKK